MNGECVKCRAPLEQPERGRPRVYCSVACRRAAEFELRRLQRRIGAAEDEVAAYRREVVGGFSLGGRPAYKHKCLKWAEDELEALEARLRLVLSDDAVKGEPS